jgi:hypothetical protein
MRDGRYDEIIHLMTTAIGAESFYNNKNNVRIESKSFLFFKKIFILNKKKIIIFYLLIIKF